ncbi:MAG: NAD-dependent epimerase/dehydratase family protein [Bacteroidales bacterium]|nr:NAD-dependent epimerase/dehydratase family protein [Bacteroidales bacterium]
MIVLLAATGLLGQNVVRELVGRGIHVRALVRRPLDVPGVEVVNGNILSYEDLLNAAKGCSAIINCAGTTDMKLKRLEDYYPVNRDLPGNLCRLLTETGIRTLVHVSTANTVAPGTIQFPADEKGPFDLPPFNRSLYAQSKMEGEKLLEEYSAANPSKRILVLLPGFLLGAYDLKPSSGQLMDTAYRKRMVFVTRGGKSFVPVKDVAKAIANALEMGESGRYLITGRAMPLKDFYKLQARTMGYSQIVCVLPDFLAMAVGYLGDFLELLGFKLIFSSRNVRQLLYQEWYSHDKAKRLLDYKETLVSQAIMDYFLWKSNKA